MLTMQKITHQVCQVGDPLCDEIYLCENYEVFAQDRYKWSMSGW